jgi:hypothetical protein
MPGLLPCPSADRMVGFLLAANHTHVVICRACAPLETKENAPPIFRENIFPYTQHCATCRALLVAGQTPAWPELFDGR